MLSEDNERESKPGFRSSFGEVVTQLAVLAAVSLLIAFLVGAWARLVYGLFMAGWNWIA